MRLVFNENRRTYNHRRCCGVIIRLNAGIPGQIKNSVRASISNSKNVTSRSSWRKDICMYIYIYVYTYTYIYISKLQWRQDDSRESLASLLQQPSSNQGLHNCWTVISLALLTIDILRSKFLAKKRQILRCLLKMIWVWVNTYRYIFSGMNIHLPAILMFTRYQGFDPSPYDVHQLNSVATALALSREK